jgi:lysophospholipase L1-like esterase
MNILMLGHSLIEFFDWEGRFPEHQAINLGVAGETVEGLLARIDGITSDHLNVDLIFVMTGANNIAMEDYEFFVPYGEIIDALKSAYPVVKIYIHSLLPIILEWISGSSIE